VPHPDEDPLIRRAQAGDREAFADIAGRYWGRLHRWLQGLTRSTHAAEDLTQDVLLKAWANLNSFQPGTHFRAWLFRIAGNAYLDSRRGPRGAPRRELPLTLAARDPDPVATLLSQETQTLVRSAVAQLPAAFRAPFLLRVHEGLSFQEIAAALGLTEETARWRVFRARRLLLRRLGAVLDVSDHDL
jgi:RNA polymerase sigma-70 factor, ECF subfamily